jgi:hypothetical protein
MRDKTIRLQELESTVRKIVEAHEVTDIHTHLYSPAFGDLLLWGVDELITYHYLIAEVFRKSSIPCEKFWSLSKREQAAHIWQTLFLENTPVSESCRGVVTTLHALGFDLRSRDLDEYRRACGRFRVEDYVDRVFELARVKEVVMTNDPLDPAERPVWLSGAADHLDPRFLPAIRLDPMLNTYATVGREQLTALGYRVGSSFTGGTLREIRRYLDDWVRRIRPKYLAASLPPDFQYPEDSPRGRMIRECVLPICREFHIPFAMMIGVYRGVNPALKSAGDGMAKADLRSVQHLLVENPENKFMLTVLSRENQHELCILSRKFRNLLVFGCWWFMNNPSLIEEITRMRFELLGLSFVPQHSDARILDQLLYKWAHSRTIVAQVLVDKYRDLVAAGWVLKREEIERDVANLFGGNFHRFLQQ